MDNINLAKALNLTERQKIENIIENYYFIDFGIVTQVSADESTVDVYHTSLPDNDGKPGQPTKTTSVELIWPGGLNFQFKWKVQVGDTVLLFGIRDFVKTVSGLKSPMTPDISLRYRQENMKAFPFGVQAQALSTIEVTDQDIEINVQNASKIKISASGIDFNNATDAFVLGTTFKSQMETLLGLIQGHTHDVVDPISGTLTSATSASLAGATNPVEGALSQTIKGS